MSNGGSDELGKWTIPGTNIIFGGTGEDSHIPDLELIATDSSKSCNTQKGKCRRHVPPANHRDHGSQ
jgi:hypothetical protein